MQHKCDEENSSLYIQLMNDAPALIHFSGVREMELSTVSMRGKRYRIGPGKRRCTLEYLQYKKNFLRKNEVF